ncbi:hypothetical protein [Bradyrhizobium sp. 162]|uniref:hypothetical protein n=1 Tax=Bradyrhizobium sp. 162 TaxID=2782635 RepID=UPI001FF8D374|nr:hypothetical protein [Bradyrhizobium sp. 162]MCK1629661.1 hypothetical protein [Bradyrhizobium sp. 162]
MTATNVIISPKHQTIHVVTDAASYDRNGVLAGFVPKFYTVPGWPGGIAIRGMTVATPILGYELTARFPTFDSLIAGIEYELPAIVASWQLTSHIEMLVVGFSESRGGPESYVIETTAETPIGVPAGTKGEYLPDPFILLRLPNVIAGPVIPGNIVIDAWFEGLSENDEASVLKNKLRKVIEMQRHSLYDDGIHWIGGYAQHTIISREGITQCLLQQWPEDQIGQRITPAPIDWREWNVRHGFSPGRRLAAG